MAMDGVKDDIHVINSRRDPQMHTMCQFLILNMALLMNSYAESKFAR